jgi:hypothetical protein
MASVAGVRPYDPIFELLTPSLTKAIAKVVDQLPANNAPLINTANQRLQPTQRAAKAGVRMQAR